MRHRFPSIFALTAAAVIGMGIFCRCGTIFFPPTGPPDRVPSMRATPSGVIEQLIQAYKSKSLYLFEDLLPPETALSDTFQFFVSPKFAATYQTRPYGSSFPPQARDTALRYIGDNAYYYYWLKDQELQSHKNLFERADAIVFTVLPSVNPGDFRYFVNDSAGDTTNVEVLMTGGAFEVHATFNGVPDVYPVAIEKQVFFLKRDPATRLWFIRKWYDFGTQD